MNPLNPHIDNEGTTRIVRYTFAQITELYKQVHDGRYKPKCYQFRRMVKDWNSNNRRERKFFSVTMPEMVEVLNKGYEFPKDTKTHIPATVARARRRMRYTDDTDGEFDWDLFSNGDTECYLNRPKRNAMIGIRFKLNFTFSASTSNEIIDEYGAWVGSVLDYLMASGYDVELSILSKCTEQYRVDSYSKQTDTEIVLSEFGKQVMPKDWASFFSPGGYRHFVFFANSHSADVLGTDVRAGYGQPLRNLFRKWDVIWETDTRTIEVRNNTMPSGKFPAESMTEKIKEIQF